jgi:hypothetical protein
MCVSTLPRPGSTIILQTTAADFLSKISDGGDPQDFQFVDSGVAHAGGHRSRRMAVVLALALDKLSLSPQLYPKLETISHDSA